ncbi:MAG: hypothetical protein DRO05_01105 [Thermoproteota archaeon]|nr:MAG: hypothetical protein DRO05_01105 [Candidatus Korarchaeota archaeon]
MVRIYECLMTYDTLIGLHRFEHTLKPKNGFLLLSPLKVISKRGKIECWGSEIDSLEIREKGIPILIRALEISDLEIWAPSKPTEIPGIIPKEWEDLVSRIKPGDVIMLLGGVDVGKSGLFAFLANKLVSAGMRVGLIDADVGQSDIGPVGTIGLSLIDETVVHPSLAKPDGLFFIGDNTPRGHLLPMVMGTRMLLDIAKSEEADVILINTTGYIHSGPARALKRFKILATQPSKVVILQREDESEHIAKLVPSSSDLIKIHVSRNIRRKNHSFRIFLRQSNIRRYLEGAESVRINIRDAKFTDTLFFSGSSAQDLVKELEELLGRPVLYAEEAPDVIVCLLESLSGLKELKLRGKPLRTATRRGYEGLYVGFLDDVGLCHGVGIIERFMPEQGTLDIYTKFSGSSEYIAFGYLKFNKNGIQIGKRGLTEP